MLVSLSGKKQSGKSTITNYLRKENWVEVSWAQPLKEHIGTYLFGLTDDQLYGSEEAKEAVIPEWGMSARRILQVVGTDLFRRHICDDFWVRLGVKKIRHFLTVGNVIVSDTRFLNELEAVKNLGGHTINVIRLGQVDTDTHDSETELDNAEFDYIVSAESGQIDKLTHQVYEIINV